MIILLFSFSLSGSAQPMADYSVHANIIYHFTKYVEWPQERKTGDFIIGIVGDSPLFDELKKIIAVKTAAGRKIVIKRVSASANSYDSHILFINEDESNSLKKIVAKTAGSPVLLVCEDEGSATRGACINFTIVSERLKLEINKNNIENNHLNIANELLRLGKRVQ